MAFLLILIILFATLLGAMCGLGGGVIIKPMLDATTSLTSFQISFISGCCLLAMSTTSIIKHYIAKTKVNVKNALLLALGSICGGILGNFLFSIIETNALATFGDKTQSIMKIIQNSLLLLVLIFVLIYMIFIKKKNKHLNLKNPILIVVVGLCLGTLSVFLDIGGGPINVAAFVLLFGMTMKEASVSSIIVIFFAQATKLIKWAIQGSYASNVIFNDLLPVYIFIFLLISAVAGGLIGSIFNKKFKEKTLSIVYCVALGAVCILSIYNIIYNIILIH